MNQLFTQKDFITAKEFAKIECSLEEGKTLKENIAKTLLLLSKMIHPIDDLLIEDLPNPHFFIDFMEDEINKRRAEHNLEMGLNELDQEKLKIKPEYLRLS
jgi:hypothetical protein